MTAQDPFKNRNKGILSKEEAEKGLAYDALLKHRRPFIKEIKEERNPEELREKAKKTRQYAQELCGEIKDELLRNAELWEREAAQIEKRSQSYNLKLERLKKSCFIRNNS